MPEPTPPTASVPPTANTNVRESYRLPKHLADRLKREADARMIGESLLVQKALEAFLPTLPALPGTEPTPAPTPNPRP